jgi:hypothetical protein
MSGRRWTLTSGGKVRHMHPPTLEERMADYHAYLRERGLGYIVDGVEPMEADEVDERVEALESEVKRLRELRVYQMPTPTEPTIRGQGQWT